ncbi:MAG: peptidoglycan-binding protein [Candidatus Nomurabacteria bacterium]|nr:peptidoglycan-binding protein [Candidatus Nomurabacteria bacterium]
MKKYILSSFAVLVFGLVLVPSFSFAQGTPPADTDPNAPASSCVSIVNNLRYRDRDANKNGEVSTLQDFLQSKGYLNSEPTGYFGLLTFKAVKDFQKDNGISPTGYVGPATKAKIKALTCGDLTTKCDYAAPPQGCNYNHGPNYNSITGCGMVLNCTDTPVVPTNNPIISSVSGPQTLNVNQTGTWTVNASDNSNPGGASNLTYSVNWGDIVYGGTRLSPSTSPQSTQQSATFTHTYSTAGTYTPTFTVTSPSTIMCFTIPCPGNGGSAKTSLSVKVGNVISTPSITVLSPNGGETYKMGQTYNIVWNSTGVDKVYIYLSKKDINGVVALIGDNISASLGKYPWTIPVDNSDIIKGGQFKIVISKDGADSTFDNSDNYFTITSPTGDGCLNGEVYSSTTGQKCSGPTISQVSGPQSLTVGQTGTWTVNASDNSNPGGASNLTYSVNWGDTITTCPTSAACTTATQAPQQSATFTHTYSTAGTYTPTFTVTNSSGQSAKTSLSVTVKNLISTNHNPVLNPIAVPVSVNAGKSYNFNFSATDADNDDLNWVINWGDSSGGGSTCILLQGGQDSCQGQNGSGWTFNMDHTWNTAGTYNVKVTVSDSKSGSASSNFSINVSTSVTCTSTTDVIEAALGNPGGTGPFEKLGLDISAHPEIIKYRIQWSNGGWSDWYVPGVNDQDSKNNLDGTARRIWSYFDDHTHEYIKCLTSTSGGGDGSSGSATRGSTTTTTTTRSGIVSFVPESSLSANALGAFDSATSNEKNSQTNPNANVSSSCEFTMTLSKGMNNPEVKCLQKMLEEKGFKINGVNAGEETTYFGYATLTALKEFQTANQLSADGIFGPATRAILQKWNIGV